VVRSHGRPSSDDVDVDGRSPRLEDVECHAVALLDVPVADKAHGAEADARRGGLAAHGYPLGGRLARDPAAYACQEMPAQFSRDDPADGLAADAGDADEDEFFRPRVEPVDLLR